MAIITLLSTLPLPETKTPENSDKIAHLIVYFLTSLIFYYTFRFRIRWTVLFAVIFSIFFGVLMEFTQNLLPYREFSIYDIIGNTSGAVMAGIFLLVNNGSRLGGKR